MTAELQDNAHTAHEEESHLNGDSYRSLWEDTIGLEDYTNEELHFWLGFTDLEKIRTYVDFGVREHPEDQHSDDTVKQAPKAQWEREEDNNIRTAEEWLAAFKETIATGGPGEWGETPLIVVTDGQLTWARCSGITAAQHRMPNPQDWPISLCLGSERSPWAEWDPWTLFQHPPRQFHYLTTGNPSPVQLDDLLGRIKQLTERALAVNTEYGYFSLVDPIIFDDENNFGDTESLASDRGDGAGDPNLPDTAVPDSPRCFTPSSYRSRSRSRGSSTDTPLSGGSSSSHEEMKFAFIEDSVPRPAPGTCTALSRGGRVLEHDLRNFQALRALSAGAFKLIECHVNNLKRAAEGSEEVRSEVAEKTEADVSDCEWRE